MLYTAYRARNAALWPLYATAETQAEALRRLERHVDMPALRRSRAVPETVAALRLTHERPEFGIDDVEVDGDPVPVSEHVVASTAFGSLVHFAKAASVEQPKVLVVPGLAGHYATLVKGTLRTLLPDHDVYVADWHNARDIPVEAGRFGFDEYVEHLIEFMAAIGPGAALMAVCQPCPAVLAAAALMAEDKHPAQPQSLILMSGPVDARVNPGRVNQFAARQSIDQLERRAVTTVPRPYRGAGRRVYPGFLQISGFMGMSPRRHLDAFIGLARDIARGESESAERTKAFYREYFAVLDVTAEFYLETARKVFIEHHLPRGELRIHGRKVVPRAIKSALLTIEAENDDMCPPGQTEAAQALCTGIPQARRRHHLQAGVGHYGVFSGTRFEQEIYPLIRSFIAEFHDAGAETVAPSSVTSLGRR